MIVFATTQPLRLAPLEPVLRKLGIDEAPTIVRSAQLADVVTRNQASLVFIDGHCILPWDIIAQARADAPACRFVLCSYGMTPSLVQAAMQCGLDGVLSTDLPPGDMVSVLQQIQRGERQFRFEPAKRHIQSRLAAQAAGTDFDSFWMFGESQ